MFDELPIPKGLDVQGLPRGGFRIELPRVRFDWMTIGTQAVMIGLSAGMIGTLFGFGSNTAANLMFVGGLVLAGVAFCAVPRAFLIHHYVELHLHRLVLRTSFRPLRDRITEIPLYSVREVIMTSRDRSKDRALHILAVRTPSGEHRIGRSLNSEQSNWLGTKIEELRAHPGNEVA